MYKKLKRCPFCGGIAHIDFAHGSNQTYVDRLGFKSSSPFLYHVFCEDCFNQTLACENSEHAIELWNRRANDV